ncbi:MAG: N-acetylmuramoyl-L-alanine amidase [Verrucomicrobiaceae bacterium]|nr:N-acetylmuramoyl-L-alanine amidase [Verrucomicrobiaceae bacterium]
MIRKKIRALVAQTLVFACGGLAHAQSAIVPPQPSPAPAPAPAAPAPDTGSAPKLNAGNIVAGPGAASPLPVARLARLSSLGTPPDWKRLDAFAKTMTRVEVETALRDLYTDPSGLPVPWHLEQDALVIQTGDPARPEVRIPFATRAEPPAYSTRTWHRATELPALKGKPPLTDIHIAIDPGHIGGNFAIMEERYLSFQPSESIQEGVLTLITAQALAERLRALGAYVTLVRDKLEPVTKVRPPELRDAALAVLKEAGFPTPKESYDGLTGDEKIISVQWQSEKLFYRVSEIHARGTKVNNEIKPDLVVCLHYNAEAWGAATAPQFSPVNHYHVLVNGCYAPVEVEQADVRFEMFHRLFSRIHEEELPLAASVSKGLAAATGLTPYVYTTPNARQVTADKAVYARNLLANRIYNCPVVYLEPYVMNHEETYRRLLAGHFIGRTLVAGRLQTSAIEDYVRGVVNGLVSYYQNRRNPL